MPKIKYKSKNPKSDFTYLESAIVFHRTATIDYLIDNGWDPATETEGGSYRKAVANNDSKTFKALLNKSGVNWDAKSEYGVGAIFSAVVNAPNMTAELLKRKVKLDGFRYSENVNLLQTAVKSGNVFSIQLLLDAGLDAQKVEPRNGKSAIQYAKEIGSNWLVPILEGKKRVAYPKWSLDDEISTGIPFTYEYKGNLDLKSIGGKDMKLSSYWSSKVVLLNIWASWCPPCVYEMPSLQSFYDKNKSKGLEVLAQSVDENPNDAVSFMRDHKLTLPLFTAAGSYANVSNPPYPLSGIPTSYIIDKNGMVVTRIVGSRDWSNPEFQRFIDLVLSIPKWY